MLSHKLTDDSAACTGAPHKDGLRLGSYSAGEAPSAAALRLVATGRGALSFVLGNAEQRYQLFWQTIRWQRVVLAFEGDQPLGFAAWQRYGRGPYAPALRDFVRVFGWAGGCWRACLFWGIELRTVLHPCYLYGLKVEVAARRRGLAGALVQAVEAQARACGAPAVTLEVKVSNEAAIALYHKLGYSFVRQQGTGPFGRFFSFKAVYLLKKPV